ncbi:dCTP deaminase domain-containing protein [Pseudomonas sp. RT6P73]
MLGKASISSLINAGALLKNTVGENVEIASYDLRLADKYWCQGDYHILSLEKPTAEIPPYSFVLVQAVEEAVLPRFITGTFDLRVKLFFSGVILSNGPQVDPGYRGSLFCMLYNASGTPVGLTRGQHFATIQFQTLSSNSAGYAASYQGKVDFTDFLNGSDSIKPGGQIIEYIDNKYISIESNYRDSRNWFYVIVGIVAAAVLAVTALAYNQVDKMAAATEKSNSATEKASAVVESASKKELEFKASSKLHSEEISKLQRELLDLKSQLETKNRPAKR